MPGVPATEDHRSALRSLPRDGHAVTITALPATALIRYREELIAVAAQAFGAAPWIETPIDAVRVIDGMWCNLGRRDFTAVAALDGPHLAGFAYGHTGTQCSALEPGAAVPYPAFEVVELAVAPAYQGRGVGKALHDALLADAPSPRLLLTHPDAIAHRLYLAWGWTDLGEVAVPSGRSTVLMRHDGHQAVGP